MNSFSFGDDEMVIFSCTVYNEETKKIIDPNASGDGFDFCCYLLNQSKQGVLGQCQEGFQVEDEKRLIWTLKAKALLDFIDMQTSKNIRSIAYNYLNNAAPWLLSVAIEQPGNVVDISFQLVMAVDGYLNIISRQITKKEVIVQRDFLKHYVIKNFRELLSISSQSIDRIGLKTQHPVYIGMRQFDYEDDVVQRIESKLLRTREFTQRYEFEYAS